MLQYTYGGENLLISHIADNDGLGSVVLCRLNNVEKSNDIILVEFGELDAIIKSLINERKYKNIYIADVSISETTAEVIDKCPELSSRILHFDHHLTTFDISKYRFINMVYERDGFKPSGTSLFYEYLLKKHPNDLVLHSKKVESFVEAIRNYDTFDFKKNGNKTGYYMTSLSSVIGKDKFILKYSLELLKDINNEFSLDNDSMQLVKKLEREIEEYIEECDRHLLRMKIGDHNVGVSISDKFRSSVGNALSEKYKNELDYILIVDFNRDQFSLRTVNDMDLAKVAKSISINGGGAKGAAGAPFDTHSKWLLDLIMKRAKEEGKSGIVRVKK